MIVRFVVICGIVDHHHLHFLFIITSIYTTTKINTGIHVYHVPAKYNIYFCHEHHTHYSELVILKIVFVTSQLFFPHLSLLYFNLCLNLECPITKF